MKIRYFRLQTGSFIYKSGISLTKQEFKIQNGSFGLQTRLSAYYLPVSLEHKKRCIAIVWTLVYNKGKDMHEKGALLLWQSQQIYMRE